MNLSKSSSTRKVVKSGFRRKVDPVENEVEQVLLEMNQDAMKTRPLKPAPYIGDIKLLYLMHKYKKKCSPTPFTYDVKTDVFRIDAFLGTPNATPEDVANDVQQKIKSCGNSFFIIPFRMNYPRTKHMTLLFVNPNEGLEFYDPEGNPLSILLREFLESVADFLGVPFQYDPPSCGLQTFEGRYFSKQMFKEDPTGFCIDWSYFMAEMRLRFPQLTTNKIEQLFLDFVDLYRVNVLSFIRGQSVVVQRMHVVIDNKRYDMNQFEEGEDFWNFYEYLSDAIIQGNETVIFLSNDKIISF